MYFYFIHCHKMVLVKHNRNLLIRKTTFKSFQCLCRYKQFMVTFTVHIFYIFKQTSIKQDIGFKFINPPNILKYIYYRILLYNLIFTILNTTSSGNVKLTAVECERQVQGKPTLVVSSKLSTGLIWVTIIIRELRSEHKKRKLQRST